MDDAPDTAADSDKLKAVHKRAMQRFDDCAYPTQELRAESLAARRFVNIPGAQWDGWIGEQFANSIMLEVNKTRHGLRKIETDYRENRVVPDFRPDGDKADQETADTLDGLWRADAYRFKSQQALDNAFSEAAAGGFGAFRLANEWEDEDDRDNDSQRINPAALIVDADQCVFFDLNAKLYDKSDARFAFVRVAMTLDALKEEYGDDRLTDFPDATDWRMRDWFTPEVAAVAEYYEKEEVADTLWIVTNKLSGEERRLWSSDLEDGDLAAMERDGWTKRRQKRNRCRVHKYILSGAEVLEDCDYIAGPNIPVVPVYGQRAFVDGLERWKGYVQDKMDSARLYNSMISRMAETSSRSPQEVPVFAPEQMPPHIADQWARVHIDRLPFLLAEPLRNEDGTIAQIGPVAKVNPPQLNQVDATLLQVANADLMEDMQDGADEAKSNTSAEAMDIAAQRVDAKSGIFLDNFRQSIQRGGEVYVGMASEVYVEQGRKVETMSEDGDDGEAVLKQPATDDAGKFRIVNDLTGAKYKVIASVTEATATRRDKTVRSAINLAEIAGQAGDAELAQVSLLTAVMNQDGEGSADMQAYARKRLVGMGVVQPNEDEQKAMEDAAENQQPDPMAELASAQAADFQAGAALKEAKIGETQANTDLKRAQTVGELTDARANVIPMRGTPDRPMIRTGAELAA